MFHRHALLNIIIQFSLLYVLRDKKKQQQHQISIGKDNQNLY